MIVTRADGRMLPSQHNQTHGIQAALDEHTVCRESSVVPKEHEVLK
jgi:hypothetical protein